MKNVLFKIKDIAPWIVTILIFFFIFREYPPSKIWGATKHLKLLHFSLFAVVYFFVMYLFDSVVITRTVKLFSKPVKLKDVILGRGITYLIMVINYAASQATFAYYLKRRYKIPISQSLSIFFFMIVIDLFWLINFAFLGTFLQHITYNGIDFGEYVRMISLILYLSLILWIGFWRGWFDRLIRVKILNGAMHWVRSKKAFAVFRKATVSDYMKVCLMRLPLHMMILIGMYLAVKTFGVTIPFIKILCYIPIVFIIGSLPITPGGLGTTNVAMVALMSPYISGDVIASGEVSKAEIMLAISLIWMFANYFMKAITGTVLYANNKKRLFEDVSLIKDIGVIPISNVVE
ncbi:MAG: lysylphosphatidylglycerol synthase transmembrane domain-containing protein [Pseudomonadota bacterium]